MNRILIWRFAAAPRVLRSLHCGSQAPEWLVLVPRSMFSTDFDQVIFRKAAPGRISRYEAPNGDIVYAGTSDADLMSHNFSHSGNGA